MDALNIYLEAKRLADTVEPPARYSPLQAGVLGGAIAGGTVAISSWVFGSDHIAGATSLAMILAFALAYFSLRSDRRRNTEAFEAEFVALLQREGRKEESRRVLQCRRPRLTASSA